MRKNLKGEWKATGDPTEVALQVFATKVGLGQPSLSSSSPLQEVDRVRPINQVASEKNSANQEKQGKQIQFVEGEGSTTQKRFKLQAEFPFSSSIKRMSMIYLDEENPSVAVVMMKGAVCVFSSSLITFRILIFIQVERLLECSASYVVNPMEDSKATALITDTTRQMFLDKAEALAAQGLRVIALGHRVMPLDPGAKLDAAKREDIEQDLTLLGLVGIFDPPRPETVGAVRACKRAGIVVHMFVIVKSCFSVVSLTGCLKAYWGPHHHRESYR